MKTDKFILSFVIGLTFCFLMQAQDNSNKIDPEKLTDLQLESLDKDLNLDDFQKLELRDYILESTKKAKTAVESGTDQTELRLILENNSRELDAKLKEVLLPEQFEKYMSLKRERAINSDKTKSKKDKKKKN